MDNQQIKKTFARYVSLNIFGMVGISCYILADTFFVARGLGEIGLAALNLAIPIYSFVNGAGLMIGMGGATRHSISHTRSIFAQSIYFVLAISLPCVIIGMFFSREIAALLGADEKTLQMTSVYIKIILCFAPAFMLNNLMICFVRNDKNPKLSMQAMLTGSVSNIILDYIFIFPFNMGMFGAVLATGLAAVISLGVLSIHFIKKNNSFSFHKSKLQAANLKDIAFLGSAALINEISSGVVMIVFNSIILTLSGNVGVAAYGVIANLALVVVAIFTGIAQGSQPLISSYYGHARPEDTKKVLKYGLVTALILAIAIYAVTYVFAQPIVAAFNKNQSAELAQIGVQGLRIYFTAFALVGFNILTATYFTATDKPKIAFLISILRGAVVIVPAAFLLSTLFGMTGVWLTLAASELIVSAVSAKALLSAG